MGVYDVAQICLNGHVVNDSVRRSPQHNQKHCDKCGAATIVECPNCKTPIHGDYYVEGFLGGHEIPAPAFCHECGKAYPWTETQIQAAKELAQELELPAEDQEVLAKSIEDIVSDTPRTALGATRFKKIMAKVGKEGAAGFRTILTSVVSEAAKKIIWPV